MKIKTRPFELSKAIYFKMSLLTYCKKAWWFPTLLLGLAVYSATHPEFVITTILLITTAIIFPLVVCRACWKDATSPENEAYFDRRIYEFDDEFISAILDDGSNSHSRYDIIVKVTKTKNYFELYISKIQFIYIPFDCFESEEDLSAFQNLLKDKLQITLPF